MLNCGGGSPIIRGQMGKEILILVDGVPINNATYRFGPIQYLSTIELAAVERIEIVRGADSVLTGVALGGIIDVITKKGPTADTGTGGSLFLRYSSADQGIVGSAAVAGRTDRYRYRIGGTFLNSSDLEGGGHRRPWGELILHVADARDAGDDRIGPGGADGFSVFHLRGGLDVGTRGRLSLGLENLFDEDYKYHSSGVFRPGRQLVLGGEIRF